MYRHETHQTGLLALRAGDLVLELAPDVGGSIAAFYSEGDDWRFDWLRPATQQALHSRDPEGMASFPLIPFCNRVRNGRMLFEGKEIAMAPNRGSSPHTIHGFAWKRPWTVVELGETQAVLQLDHPAGDWPYAFLATQRITLTDEGLTVAIEVENRDKTAMPLGVGHHPYLPRREGTVLQANVERVWLTDDEVMPTGLDTAPVVRALRKGALLKDMVADNNFVGWDRRAYVEWPADRATGRRSVLTMEADAPLDYFVLYSPQGKDHFCIEPVSNCTDWLNVRGYTRAELGGAVLAPGETYSARFSLYPRWLG